MAERLREAIRFRLTSSVIRKIMHFCATLWASEATYGLYLNVTTQKDLVAEFHRENASFTRETAN